jgi:Protein of unknown function (DUF3800)
MKRSRWLSAFSPGAFAMSSPIHAPAYHIFCDEFGDQGLKKTASEFFIVSAVVVASGREPELPRWVAKIKEPQTQGGAELHFADLNEQMKLRATRFLGKMPVRCFTLISHKANMIGHRNVRCEISYNPRLNFNDDGSRFETQIRQKTKYPNFVLKVLLERVTAWCERRIIREFGGPRPVSITIAQRGGFYIDAFKEYIEIDRLNQIAKTGTLPVYLRHSIIEPRLVATAPAANVAGLQLADLVTGAFSRAIDEKRFGKCDRRFVYNLAPRIARTGNARRIAGYGVTGLPWELWQAKFNPEQERVFRMFGYGDEKLVRPGPILPEGF